MPIGTLSQKIQCQFTPSAMAPPTSGPMRDREAGDAAPRAEGDRATLRRHRAREDRQAQRRDEGAADALDRAGDDQDVARRRERRGGRPGGEDEQADDEHAAAAEAVAERGAGEQQDRERQGVGVDHPLERRERRAEVDLDHGEGGRHDEVVEGHHEQGDRRDGEGPGGSGPHRVHLPSECLVSSH